MMALSNIKYGSLASSEVMNNNFEYLDNRISNLTNIVNTNQAGISSNIANINSTVSSMQENTSKEIKDLQDRKYIKKTYVNGNSGYRIWSDNFCEQWGYSYFNTTNIFLLQKYKDTFYNITFGIDDVRFEGQMAHPKIISKQPNCFSASYINPKGTTGYGNAHWRTAGYIETEVKENGI